MRRGRTPTFSGKRVCQALDVPQGTLNSWAFHGLFKGLDAETTKPGKARRFTLADLYRLAILQQLMRIGVPADRAKTWSMLCVNYMELAEFSTAEILFFEDGRYQFGLNSEFTSEPESEAPVLRLTIYPREITRMLRGRLGLDRPDASDKGR